MYSLVSQLFTQNISSTGHLLRGSLLLLFALAWPPSLRPAQAGYVVTLQEVGPNVVATGSGAIDLTGLTFFLSNSIVGTAVLTAPRAPEREREPKTARSNEPASANLARLDVAEQRRISMHLLCIDVMQSYFQLAFTRDTVREGFEPSVQKTFRRDPKKIDPESQSG
jgi:hypothetical protein